MDVPRKIRLSFSYSGNKYLDFVVNAILILGFGYKLLIFIEKLCSPDINRYTYTELLINYAGGFVRRGLTGQLLYDCCSYFGLPVITVIQFICIISFIIVCVFLFYYFNKKNYCWWLLLSPLFLSLTTSIIRKDFFLYIVLIVINLLIVRLTKHKSNMWVICLLMVFGLLIHETFIFWAIPVSVLLMASYNTGKVNFIIGLGVVLICAVIVFYFKGTAESAYMIRESWNSSGLLTETLIPIKENSIGALEWDTVETFKTHIRKNFYSISFGWAGIPIRIIGWVAIYYLLTNFLFVFQRRNKDDHEKPTGNMLNRKTDLSILFIFNTICLLPMFLFLSNDWGRIYQYAVMGSFIPFLIIPEERLNAIFSRNIRGRVERFNRFLCNVLKPNVFLMCFLLLIIGVSPSSFLLPEAYMKSPLGSVSLFVQWIVYSICGNI